MKKNFLIIVLFSLLIPLTITAEEGEIDSSGMDMSSTPVEEMSAPSEATPTESSSSDVVPEAMEEATFDDVSYE